MQPVRVTASSLAEALEHIDTDKTVNTIYFELLSYQTLYRGIVNEEWFTLRESRLENVITENEIRSKSFEVRQEYQFLFHTTSQHPNFNLVASLVSDKHKSKAILIIDPSSTIPLKKGIQEYLKREIWNYKLRHKLLIDITDNNLDEQINRLLLRIQKEGPLNAPYKMSITHFFQPTDPINDSVILHYKKEEHQANLIEGVQSGDLIFEYIFAQRGSDGRSCSGKFIAAPEPLKRYATAIAFDHETIRSLENEGSILFYALTSGYVKRQNGIFSISHELRLKGASLKDTGSIETGSDKEIYIKINHQDNTRDAVGSGVNIDVQTLDVAGTIGSNTKIQAQDVTIGAQTHKKSFIEVQENATIHLHRGDLKAKNATIEILEAGKVEANTVHVTKMLGGEIIAENVTIDTLYSNANITALKSITINTIVGDGNNLVIDPRSIPSYHDKIKTFEQQLKELSLSIRQHSKEILGKELSLAEQTNRIKQTQLKIKNALSQNQPPIKADMVQVQKYKFAIATLHEEQTKLHAQKEEHTTLVQELKKLYDADIHATITHHSIYNGHTRITFIDPKTSQKHSTSPQGAILHIRLRCEGEDKKIIFET